MRNKFLLAVSQLTRFHLLEDQAQKTTASEPYLLVAVRLLLGIAYALTALVVMWIVKHQLIGAILATLAVTSVRGFLTAWRDKLMSLRLACLFFPTLRTTAKNPIEQQFQSATLNWVMLARPLGVFFLLLSGYWYWLVPVAGLGAAFAEDIVAPTLEDNKGEDWRSWGLAAGVSLLFFLLASKLSAAYTNHLLTGLFVCIIAWLLASWLKRRTVALNERFLATYCGELAVIIMLLLGISF